MTDRPVKVMRRLQAKYRELSELLIRRIEQGEWKPGDQLPSEMSLAEEYGVSYMTLRSAVRELVQQGRLRRIKGSGTYVSLPDNPDKRPVLGLLLTEGWHSLDPFYFPPIVTGFATRAAELGYQVHLADRTEPMLDFLKFQELHVNAVACILLGEPDLSEANQLLDRGVKVLAINRYNGSRRIVSVNPDNRYGAYSAAKHLLKLGHRRFAFLAGPTDNFDAVERQRGVEQALREAKLAQTTLEVLEGEFLEDSGYERAHELIRKKHLPTAVLCASDLAAIGLMRAFFEEGVAVPNDVSVVGFGDFRLAGYTTPALTTVRLPLVDLGACAAEALSNLYRGIRTESRKLDCPLIFRESVCRPRE